MNVIALMKPIITYSLLAVLMFVTLYGLFSTKDTESYNNYKEVVFILEELGILGLAEMAISFGSVLWEWIKYLRKVKIILDN